MAWIDKYTFTLSHTDGNRAVVPIIPDFQYSFQKEDDDAVFHRTLSETELVFIGADFTYLNDIRNGANSCDPITLTVTTTCGGATVTPYTGIFHITDCNPFDLDNCRVTVSPKPSDDYTEMFENWEEEINILSGTTKSTVYGLLGDLEAIRCSDLAYVGSLPLRASPYTTVETCISPGEGWVLFRLQYFYGIPGPDSIYSTWVREKVTGSVSEPIGNGWIDLGGGDWAREPQTAEFPTILIDAYDSNTNVLTYDAYFALSGVAIEYDLTGDITDEGYELLLAGSDFYYKSAVYDNGVTLERVLEALNPISGGTFVSDFFSINPDATYPVNDAYTGAIADLANVIVYQMTDVTTWDASENARRGITTYKKFYEYLRNKFDVRQVVSGTEIRIEHISYFENVMGLDLTVAPYASQIAGRNKFSYLNPTVRYEYFKGMSSPVTDYFEGLPIEYTTCVNEDSQTKNYPVKDFMHDLGYTQSYPEKVDEDGFFVIGAALSDSFLYVEVWDGYANGKLSTTYVHDLYWRYRRAQQTGLLNGASVTFESWKPNRLQEGLTIKLPDCSVLINYNPALEMNTGLGWGEVQNAVVSLKNCSITPILHHDN